MRYELTVGCGYPCYSFERDNDMDAIEEADCYVAEYGYTSEPEYDGYTLYNVEWDMAIN